MTLQEQFTAEVQAFLADYQFEPASFGRKALNDPNFVYDLQAGRCPNLRTIERVREFMNSVASDGSRRRLDS